MSFLQFLRLFPVLKYVPFEAIYSLVVAIVDGRDTAAAERAAAIAQSQARGQAAGRAAKASSDATRRR